MGVRADTNTTEVGTMKFQALLLVALLAVTRGQLNCSQVLAPLKLSDPGGKISHGIHSLTLNTLRYYFDSNATEDNGIPTVNLDRSSSESLHPNAIFVNLTNSHSYGPFFALDNVLSHLDDQDWGIKNAYTLDRIAHDIHMHMIWQAASGKYLEFMNTPPSSDTCPCLFSTHNASITAHLNMMAEEIRIPEQFSSPTPTAVQGRRIPAELEYLGIYFGGIGWRTTTRRTTRSTTTTKRPLDVNWWERCKDGKQNCIETTFKQAQMRAKAPMLHQHQQQHQCRPCPA